MTQERSRFSGIWPNPDRPGQPGVELDIWEINRRLVDLELWHQTILRRLNRIEVLSPWIVVCAVAILGLAIWQWTASA